MILVDTSVWIDHLRESDPRLVELLGEDQVGSHTAVIEELALGSIGRRAAVLELLSSLHRFPVLSHTELMALVDRRRLWGRGLSAVDAHLLGSVLVEGGAQLWTRDQRLMAGCRAVGAASVKDS